MRAGKLIRDLAAIANRPVEDPDDYADRRYREAIERQTEMRATIEEARAQGSYDQETYEKWISALEETNMRLFGVMDPSTR